MSNNLWGIGLLSSQQIRRKIFVSYHHRGDQEYYNAFSKVFHDTYETIYDNSLERSIDSDNVDYVMRRIREDYIEGTSCTIVLVGKDTWGRKYVDWEIMATLEKEHGLIGVQLPTLPINEQGRVNVPSRLSENINSDYALWGSWQDITSRVQNLSQYIEQANAKSRKLINNSLSRRLRNE